MRVSFAPSPEPTGFPAGAFRAATKMCVTETHFAVTDAITRELELSVQGGHVRAVTVARGGDAGGALAPAFVACLQKLYAKPTLVKAPAKLSVTLTLTPGSGD